MRYFILLLYWIAILCLDTAAQDTCKTTIHYGSNTNAGAFAKINGIRMYYETYGRTGKPTLLLIHGNGDAIHSMRCQIEHFKDKYSVIIADSRAHGKTENGKKELTYELMAQDYNALLDHLQVDSAYIIGQSDGGIISLLLAMEYPSKCKRIVAMAPNLRPDTTALFKWATDLTKRGLAIMEKQLGEGDKSPELLRKKMHYDLMDKHPNIATANLSNIKVPVLIMSSDEDLIVPEHILEIYRAIPKANLLVLPAATHFMLREEYKLFNQMAERFLEKPFKKPTTEAILNN